MMKFEADHFLVSHINATNAAGQLRLKYLINGIEPLLLEESSQHILNKARQAGFGEHDSFNIETRTDWNPIFSLCEGLSLFSDKRIISLNLPDGAIPVTITEKLIELNSLLHDDLLVIFKYPKSAFALEKNKWYKTLFTDNTIVVNCNPPTRERFPNWVAFRCKQLGINIDNEAIIQLCYHYEGNLLALTQTLQQISLLFANRLVTRINLESVIFDAAHFTPSHWIDALLSGGSKRAFHILKQLQKEDFEVIILLRSLQNELLQLLKISSQMHQVDMRLLFDKFNVWKNRRPLYSEALKRLNYLTLTNAIDLLAKLEVSAKSDPEANLWADLIDISLLLCNKPMIRKPNGNIIF